MKQKTLISVSLVTLMLLLTLVLSTNVFALNPSTLYDEQTIKDLEVKAGIETKQDSEVFSISENGNRHEIYFLEKNQGLAIIPILDEKQTLSKESNTLIPIFTRLKDGYKVSTNISSSSPLSYAVKIDIPYDWKIDFCRDKTGQIINGSLAIYDNNDEPIASTGLPTAFDAIGKELVASYDINENNITINIEPTENIQYPISTSFGIYAQNNMRGFTYYFKYAGFNLVYEGSLTLGPRYFDEGSVISCENAWNAVVDLFYPYEPYWTDNLSGMNDQYWCHANFAKNKENWNLEPWRPDVGYWETVKAKCNPE